MSSRRVMLVFVLISRYRGRSASGLLWPLQFCLQRIFPPRHAPPMPTILFSASRSLREYDKALAENLSMHGPMMRSESSWFFSPFFIIVDLYCLHHFTPRR